ncbi:MAG: ATP-binding cassette domain-containing protein, partial [Propionibacteriaceae bacterium]|nr:ATP-binding cassette domain-containing protein [Propionibacteriaceae bacterium]
MAMIAQQLRLVERGQVTVDDVNLIVPDGTVSAILTADQRVLDRLIDLLSGAIAPSAGTVEIDELAITDPGCRQQIGRTPAWASLDLWATLRRNLTVQARLHGLSRDHTVEQIGAMADQLQLFQQLDRPLFSLTAAERTRARLAIALVHQPSAILLQEPLADADLIGYETVTELLTAERQLGHAVVIASSDPETASLADQVELLVAGRPVASGSPAALVSVNCPATLTLQLADLTAARRELADFGLELPPPDPNQRVIWANLAAGQARDIIALLGERVLDFDYHYGTLAEVFHLANAIEPALNEPGLNETTLSGSGSSDVDRQPPRSHGLDAAPIDPGDNHLAPDQAPPASDNKQEELANDVTLDQAWSDRSAVGLSESSAAAAPADQTRPAARVSDGDRLAEDDRSLGGDTLLDDRSLVAHDSNAAATTDNLASTTTLSVTAHPAQSSDAPTDGPTPADDLAALMSADDWLNLVAGLPDDEAAQLMAELEALGVPLDADSLDQAVDPDFPVSEVISPDADLTVLDVVPLDPDLTVLEDIPVDPVHSVAPEQPVAPLNNQPRSTAVPASTGFAATGRVAASG